MAKLITLLATFIVVQSNLSAGEIDPQMVWPLCGRISQSPPSGWVDQDGCPASRAGDPVFNDFPLSSSYGPRPLASENNRYDFHRGVDIATPIGTPVFAVTDGIVKTAGPHSSFFDPLIRIRHFRPGESSCTAGGCYHSYYLHMNGWVVVEDQAVVKGQLIGYSGASGASGFEHLHFEIRDAPASDPYSSWSRDARHPLGVLPYQVPNLTGITINEVDDSAPSAIEVDLTLTSNRYDLVSVLITAYDQSLNPVYQPGDTPDQNGYNIYPASFAMESRNFQYSHKDSTNFPWSSYGTNGPNQCPYHALHGNSYNANIHLDAQHPDDPHEGLFNGVHVKTKKYWPGTDYWLNLRFLQIQGPARCIEATAVFASGDTFSKQWGNCWQNEASPPVTPTRPNIEVTNSGRGKRNQCIVKLTWQDDADNQEEYILGRCRKSGKSKSKGCANLCGQTFHLPDEPLTSDGITRKKTPVRHTE
jgi:murein DD-endopeptidase MepM/ murein hydrolase activator NlpD